MIHIGERIKEVFEKQPKGHNIEWFAAQLHCHRANLYNIFSRSTIDTDLLFRISRILNHDFFRDLSSELNQDSDTQQAQLDLYNNLLTGMDEIIKKHIAILSSGNSSVRLIPEQAIQELAASMSDPFKNIATDRKSITEDLSTIKDINIYTIRGKHDLNFSLNGNTRILELGNVDLVNHSEDFIKRT